MKKEAIMSSEIMQKIERVAKSHGIFLVMLYGSVARGTTTVSSDIDIGILGAAPFSTEDEAVIGDELARAIGSGKVEVHSLHQAAPLFLFEVMRDGVVLYADTLSRAQVFKLYAWKLFVETKPLRDARFEQMKKRIAAYA